MAISKPIPDVASLASRDNVTRQYQKNVDYTESVLTDIGKATENNELVQARLGHSNLNQTFEHLYNHLPVFMYEGFTNGGNIANSWIKFDKIVLYWKGKQVVRTNRRFGKTGDDYSYFVFDISNNDFTVVSPSSLQSDQIIIFRVYKGFAIQSSIATLWGYDYKQVDPSSDEINNKVCFAYHVSANIVNEPILHLNKKITYCTIDFLSQKLLPWRPSNDDLTINNSVFLNIDESYFNFLGENNHFFFKKDQTVHLKKGSNYYFQGSTFPTGHIGSGYVVPPHCLELNGQTVSVISYRRLENFVTANNLKTSTDTEKGLFYIAGSAMRLPDFRDRFVRAKASTRSLGSMQDDEFKSHNHIYSTHSGGSGSSFGSGSGSGSRASNTGKTGGDETRPKNVALKYFVKH